MIFLEIIKTTMKAGFIHRRRFVGRSVRCSDRPSVGRSVSHSVGRSFHQSYRRSVGRSVRPSIDWSVEQLVSWTRSLGRVISIVTCYRSQHGASFNGSHICLKTHRAALCVYINKSLNFFVFFLVHFPSSLDKWNRLILVVLLDQCGHCTGQFVCPSQRIFSASAKYMNEEQKSLASPDSSNRSG